MNIDDATPTSTTRTRVMTPPRTQIDDARCDAAIPRNDESGLGLVELLVVLVIIGIIGAVAFATLGSTKSNTSIREARTAAFGLGEAIEQFQRDHGGRLPAQPGTSPADWNGTWTSPIDRGNRSGTSMKSYADATVIATLTRRAAALENSQGAVRSGLGTTTTRIRYYADAPRGLYALVVRTRAGSTWKQHCYVTNAEVETASGKAFLAPMIKQVGGQRRC